MYFPVYWCSVPCKTRKLVSKIMHDIFLEYCTRKVIQWDNGGEFKGPFESLLLKHRIKENNKPSISSGVAEQMREVATIHREGNLDSWKVRKGFELGVRSTKSRPFDKRFSNWSTPFEIFFGRQHEKHTPLPDLSQMKQRDRKSTARCVQRMN